MFGIAAHNARDRSKVGAEAGPVARILGPSPKATDGAVASRGVGLGLLVLTAGPVQYFYRRYPTGPVASSLPD